MARVFVLSGPTAAGKTELALSLAEECGAGIVSADAMTVYRGLDIGTAKPLPATLARHPHACVNVRDLNEEFSVEDFCQAFDEACRTHDSVIVVGGTPFYLSALIRPLAALPSARPDIRERLNGLHDLHAALQAVDPLSAARLHPNDRVRLIRALEVYEITGQPMSELHAAGGRRPALDAAVCWVDREGLRARIASRIEQMLSRGYLEEVRGIVEKGADPDYKPLKSFAYRHLMEHVRGVIDLEEAVRLTERDTWRFARKQRSWARSMGWVATTPEEAHQQGRVALGGPG